MDVHQFVGVVLFRGFLSSQLVHNFVHSRWLEPEAPFSVVSLTEWQAKVATSNCIPLAAGAAKNPLVHVVLVVKMTFKSRPSSAGLQTHAFFCFARRYTAWRVLANCDPLDKAKHVQW